MARRSKTSQRSEGRRGRSPASGSAPGAEFEMVRSGWGMNLGLAVVAALLLMLAFPPLRWHWAAHIALAPLLVMLARAANWKVTAIAAAAGALVFYGVQLYWLWAVNVPSYLGVLLFVVPFWPAFAVVARWLTRRGGVPLVVVAPAVWVPLELLRAHALTGFPWLMLGHAQVSNLWLLQAADIGGAYLPGALSAATAGLLVDLLTRPLFLRYDGHVRLARSAKIGAAALAAAWIAVGVYGWHRLQPVETTDGPDVLTVQCNVEQSLTERVPSEPERELDQAGREADGAASDADGEPAGGEESRTYAQLKKLTGEAIAGEGRQGLDLVVWPETMVPHFVNEEFLKAGIPPESPLAERQIAIRRAWTEMHDLAMRADAPLLAGALTIFPGERRAQLRNSALLMRPDVTQYTWAERYDKVHLVPFGEYVPFRDSFNALYRLLLVFTPYTEDYNLEAGEEFTLMEAGGATFAVAICFEDAFARECRRMVYEGGRKRADFLVNISNDGWFGGSIELEQHWDLSVFRAVENRVPVVRSCNTGISGFIDSSGRWVERVTGSAGGARNVQGTARHQLQLDPRTTFYGTWGDVFAYALTALGIALVVLTALHPRGSENRRS